MEPEAWKERFDASWYRRLANGIITVGISDRASEAKRTGRILKRNHIKSVVVLSDDMTREVLTIIKHASRSEPLFVSSFDALFGQALAPATAMQHSANYAARLVAARCETVSVLGLCEKVVGTVIKDVGVATHRFHTIATPSGNIVFLCVSFLKLASTKAQTPNIVKEIADANLKVLSVVGCKTVQVVMLVYAMWVHAFLPTIDELQNEFRDVAGLGDIMRHMKRVGLNLFLGPSVLFCIGGMSFLRTTLKQMSCGEVLYSGSGQVVALGGHESGMQGNEAPEFAKKAMRMMQGIVLLAHRMLDESMDFEKLVNECTIDSPFRCVNLELWNEFCNMGSQHHGARGSFMFSAWLGHAPRII